MPEFPRIVVSATASDRALPAGELAQLVYGELDALNRPHTDVIAVYPSVREALDALDGGGGACHRGRHHHACGRGRGSAQVRAILATGSGTGSVATPTLRKFRARATARLHVDHATVHIRAAVVHIGDHRNGRHSESRPRVPNGTLSIAMPIEVSVTVSPLAVVPPMNPSPMP
ncbi:MAG: hypothetical protein ACLTSX_06580 [Collinsella sp.]